MEISALTYCLGTYTFGGVAVLVYKNSIVDEICKKMKYVEEITKVLGNELKTEDYYIEDMGCPHEQPERLPEGYVAIYVFAYYSEGEYEFLKIGKANENSNARFTSQHYGFRANNTLARSICADEKFQKKGITEENVRQWMLQNLHRINILIKADCGRAMTELVEAIFHYSFRPRYEGNI